MQIPIPPVNQCNRRHKAKPDQEKYAGTNASKAPKCIAPIQIKEGQASRWGAGSALVVVVMINLWSYTSPRDRLGGGSEASGPIRDDDRCRLARSLMRCASGMGSQCSRPGLDESRSAFDPKWFSLVRVVNQARHPQNRGTHLSWTARAPRIAQTHHFFR
jgi:hypothetical protein